MEKKIAIEDLSSLKDLFGVEDKNLRLIEKEFKVIVTLKPDGVSIKGAKEGVDNALGFMKRIVSLGKEGMVFNRQELLDYLNSKDKDKEDQKYGIRVFSSRKKFVFPKTKGQEEYIAAMGDYDIVFSVGPAGTGKTYLTMAMAVNYLMEKKVRRIILTRPAIEAGESLGFLPGDMHEKLSPYLRPLYDALYDMMEVDMIEDYLETGIIEIAPLAYMRGRTLNNAFVILDEAQNCTGEQLKMFLTRLGFDSKTVITGDVTQSDLPGGKPMGLIEAIKFLKPIKGIKFINLTKKDVVRHPLVQKIIQAYEDFYSEKRSAS